MRKLIGESYLTNKGDSNEIVKKSGKSTMLTKIKSERNNTFNKLMLTI